MIFSKNWITFNYSNQTDEDNSESGNGYVHWLRPGRGDLIIVYQGDQPSIEEYITNYSSSYGFDSENILQLIFKKNDHSYSELLVTDPDDQDYTQALKSFRAGTATWACVISRGAGNSPGYDISGYYNISDSDLTSIEATVISKLQGTGPIDRNALNNGADGGPSGIVSIVPVSSLSDNGVIKFGTTEFSHPDEADEDRALDMSITVSVAE